MLCDRSYVVNLGYHTVNRSCLVARTILQELATEALPDWSRFESATRVKSLRAGECLFRLDVQHPYVYFVTQGIIKMVYETADGKIWIKEFAEEGRFFASLVALAPSGRTSFSAYAVCDTVVEQTPYQVLLELADSHDVWQRTLRRAYEIYGYRKEMREKELLTLSAEERYRRFVKGREMVAARLTDRDISGYVRVTPVALSRIKRRIRQENISDSSQQNAALDIASLGQ